MLSITDAANQFEQIMGFAYAAATTFSPTNADGSPNAAAQDTAVQALITLMQQSGLFPTSFSGITLTPANISGLSLGIKQIVDGYNTATRRSTA